MRPAKMSRGPACSNTRRVATTSPDTTGIPPVVVSGGARPNRYIELGHEIVVALAIATTLAVVCLAALTLRGDA